MATNETEITSGAFTPQSLILRRRLAEAMLNKGMETGPIAHPAQGWARIAQAIMGGMQVRDLEEREERTRREGNQAIADLFAGQLGLPTGNRTPPGNAPPPPTVTTPDTAAPPPPPTADTPPAAPPGQSDDLLALSRAVIGRMEGGRRGYQTEVESNSPTRGRQVALGQYGIMDFNLPEWSRAALGREVTREEFLASPEIQDRIFNHRFGILLAEERGNVGNAAQRWFAGSLTNMAPDRFGTRGPGYRETFLRHLAGAQPPAPNAPPPPVVDENAAFEGAATPPPGVVTPPTANAPPPPTVATPPPAAPPPPAANPPPPPTVNTAPPSGQAFVNTLPAADQARAQALLDQLRTTNNPQAQTDIMAQLRAMATRVAPLTPVQQAQIANIQSEIRHRSLQDEALIRGNRRANPENVQERARTMLERLAQAPHEFGTQAFERAIGPLSGAQTDERSVGWIQGIINTIPSAVARLGGHIRAGYEGGAIPTDVRTRIDGDTQALVNLLRPMLRVAGEGSQSNMELQQLMDMVGNLRTASSVTEYNRRLEELRLRLNGALGLQIQPTSPQGPSPNPPLSAEEQETSFERRLDATPPGWRRSVVEGGLRILGSPLADRGYSHSYRSRHELDNPLPGETLGQQRQALIEAMRERPLPSSSDAGVVAAYRANRDAPPTGRPEGTIIRNADGVRLVVRNGQWHPLP